MATLLTDKKINSLKPGEWATESNARGAGQLQARGLKNGRVTFYFRYTSVEHKQVRISLGSELTLSEARRKANALSHQHQEGMMVSRKPSLAKTARKSISARLGNSATLGTSPTLGNLLMAYVEDLSHRGCSSAREVKNAFERHIHQTWPELWGLPIVHITTDYILQIIKHVAAQDKLRAADKLRCYIRAAYATAIQAKMHIESLPAFTELNINHNPARDIPPIRQSSQTKDRVLSLAELQTYWHYISQMNNATGALLRFHLLTGGQRIQQLARCTLQDYDSDSQTITLKDPKGRRHNPRLHTIPLLPQAQQAIQEMLLGHPHVNNANNNPVYIWSVTQGAYGACYSTASKALNQVIEQIKRREAKKSEGGYFLSGQVFNSFTLGDIRRTVETRLAAAGISREIRAQLQSHGLSGVQVRHYDRHDYLQEKRDALETLFKLLTEPLTPQRSQHVSSKASLEVQEPEQKQEQVKEPVKEQHLQQKPIEDQTSQVLPKWEIPAATLCRDAQHGTLCVFTSSQSSDSYAIQAKNGYLLKPTAGLNTSAPANLAVFWPHQASP